MKFSTVHGFIWACKFIGICGFAAINDAFLGLYDYL